jgi:hypothetical protein
MDGSITRPMAGQMAGAIVELTIYPRHGHRVD